MLLVAVLVVSMLVLVPGQSRTALGAELMVAGLLAWVVFDGDLFNGLCRTESRAWPACPILIPRGGPPAMAGLIS